MKSMTCRQLGGACDKIFQGNTFEEVAGLSKLHGMEMFHTKDEAHLKIINEMQELMETPGEMEKWLENKRQAFEDLPTD
jgi:hypothetical protein